MGPKVLFEERILRLLYFVAGKLMQEVRGFESEGQGASEGAIHDADEQLRRKQSGTEFDPKDYNGWLQGKMDSMDQVKARDCT